VTDKDLSVEDRKRLNGSIETVLYKASNTRKALLDQVLDVVVNCSAAPKGASRLP
jgi:hypothetical protein